MKIVYDYEIFTKQKYGGISRYFAKLAEQLHVQDQEVKIVAPIYKNQYLKDLPKGVVSGYGPCEFPRKARKIVRQINRSFSKFQLKRLQPDVVHLTYYAQTIHSEKNAPVVITIHDMIHELFPEAFTASDSTSTIKKAAVESADHIICISKSTKKDLMRFLDVAENKISVIHHGVDALPVSDPDFSPAVTSPHKPYILHVGERGGYKNFDGLLHAVAQDSNLKADIQIVAFGSAPFSKSEQELIRNLGFLDTQVVHISGDDQLLRYYYQHAAAFIFPTRYEGFGMPPLEAMALGCPVISSNTSSMPEVIGNAAEFFDPTQTDDIAQAIKSVVYSTARQKTLRAKGYKRIKLFTWSKCATDTLAAYNKL